MHASVIIKKNTWNKKKHSNLKSIVRPGSKLHLAPLIVEGKPGDVDFAGGLEDARRHVQTRSVVPDDHVGRVGSVEALVGAEIQKGEKQEPK